ncbi:MAG TPA: type II secretion system protein, partial [Planctomycetota bacterium]|nr:type II secretion system protein [Planctomycetota bacterium]
MRKGKKGGFTLIELMIVIAIIAIIAAIAIPGLLSSQRASNERNASTSLKTLTSAEADFRANDRDWNHVNDFWTGDVKGLYCMTSAAVIGNAGG